MDSHFCVEALEEALERHGTPEILIPKWCHVTGEAFTGVLKNAGSNISMDGKGSWVDTMFVDCLWHRLECEEAYRNAYQNPRQAHAGIEQYFRFYNTERRHQALDRQTPDTVYFSGLNVPIAA